jgi:hypothetical protein
MATDRYLKGILTVIAIELGYLAVIYTATPVTAQQQATPVVITGIDLQGARNMIPVAVLGETNIGVGGSNTSGFQLRPLDVKLDDTQPVRVAVPLPLEVHHATPIRIEADRPIRVENVGYVGTPTPR